MAEWRVLGTVPRSWADGVAATLRSVDVPFRVSEAEEAWKVRVEVQVGDDEVAAAWSWMERLLEIYDDARAAAKKEGLEIKPYKPAERHVLLAAGVEALHEGHEPDSSGFFAEALHRFVWRQGLPNGNHRSTLAWILEMMENSGLDVVDRQEAVHVGEEFAKASKPLISEKEWKSDLEPYRRRHHEAARTAVDALLVD